MAFVQWYYIMDQQSAHTLTDNVYIQMSKYNCIHCFFTPKSSDHSCGFSAHPHLLLIWLHLLIELSDFQQVVCKQSIKTLTTTSSLLGAGGSQVRFVQGSD